MNVICKVCNGKGKVDTDFGMGKCKEIEGDPFHRVCPGCDGTGMQYERETSYPSRDFDDLFKRKKKIPYKPWDPWKIPPFKIEPPWPYKDPIPRRKKIFSIN